MTGGPSCNRAMSQRLLPRRLQLRMSRGAEHRIRFPKSDRNMIAIVFFFFAENVLK
jgi:hypothetical protein